MKTVFVYWLAYTFVTMAVGWKIKKFYDSFEKPLKMPNIFEDLMNLEKELKKMAEIHERKSGDKIGTLEGGEKDRAVSNAFKYAATKTNEIVKNYMSDHPDTFFNEEFLASSTHWNLWEKFMLMFQPVKTETEEGFMSKVEIEYKKYNGKVYILNTNVEKK